MLSRDKFLKDKSAELNSINHICGMDGFNEKSDANIKMNEISKEYDRLYAAQSSRCSSLISQLKQCDEMIQLNSDNNKFIDAFIVSFNIFTVRFHDVMHWFQVLNAFKEVANDTLDVLKEECKVDVSSCRENINLSTKPLEDSISPLHEAFLIKLEQLKLINRGLLHLTPSKTQSDVLDLYLHAVSSHLPKKDLNAVYRDIAAKGNVEFMKILVKHGADIASVSEATLRNALHVAVIQGKLEVVRYLKAECEKLSADQASAIFNAKDSLKKTPLEYIDGVKDARIRSVLRALFPKKPVDNTASALRQLSNGDSAAVVKQVPPALELTTPAP